MGQNQNKIIRYPDFENNDACYSDFMHEVRIRRNAIPTFGTSDTAIPTSLHISEYLRAVVARKITE
jgi:hypothetical protein